MGPANKRIFCLSLGCSKNTVDSERIVANLSDAGFAVVSEADSADIAIVNTCGFIRSAVEENIAAILDLIEMKNSGNLEKVGVVGCLAARYGDELKRELPEVDFWAGCEDTASILMSLGAPSSVLPNQKRLAPESSPHVRYLKISEGCDMACSYCTIPSIRGPLRSRSIADLTREAEDLAEAGAAEICLVAQDLSSYGTDKGSRLLIPLLDALESSLPYDIWIRLLYLQPSGVDRALLERVAGGRQVLPYLDIPVQHASLRILGMMNRGGDVGYVFETARAIRPDFALRTTCMVGFPGETRADFASLLRFIERVRFDRIGAFEFSPEEGTVAAGLPGQVPGRTKKARLERLMSVQAEISLSRQSAFVGRELEVLVDAVNGDGSAEGRSFREAPEVDGVIDLPRSEIVFRAGEKVMATITEAFEHDLSARAVGAGTAVPA
jgi:ribosomal protein S12 methylthiotransferase